MGPRFWFGRGEKTVQTEQIQEQNVDAAGALNMVKKLPEVDGFIKEVESAGRKAYVELDGDEENGFTVHVYEIVNGHRTTFNWYTVNKDSGKIEKMFD